MIGKGDYRGLIDRGYRGKKEGGQRGKGRREELSYILWLTERCPLHIGMI